MMKVITPLHREAGNQAVAHGCKCVCNVQMGNHSDGDAGAWWLWNPDCGCGCNPKIPFNKEVNHDAAQS